MLGLTIVVLSHLCCMTIGISINTNGSFVQAVSDFVTSENNALLDLQVNISLLDSNFVPASTSPDRGTLTIQNAAPSPGQVLVLDTSNKANLTPVFVPTAQLLLRGLKICNMCIAKLPWSVTPPSQWASALQIHLFNRSRQVGETPCWCHACLPCLTLACPLHSPQAIPLSGLHIIIACFSH